MLRQGMQPSQIAEKLESEWKIGGRQVFRMVADVRTQQAEDAAEEELEAKKKTRTVEAERMTELVTAPELDDIQLVGADGRSIPKEVAGDFGVLHWAIRSKQLQKLYDLEIDLDVLQGESATPHQKTTVARIKLLTIQEQNKMLGVDKPPIVERKQIREEAAGEEEDEIESTLDMIQRHAEQLESVRGRQDELQVERQERAERLAKLDAEKAQSMQEELEARAAGKAAREDAADTESITEAEGAWWETLE